MKKALSIIIVLAIAAGAIYYFFPNIFGISRISGGPSAPQEESLKRYQSDAYGVTFDYPDTYSVTETDASVGADTHVITLVDREAAANAPENGEGPTSITIVIASTTHADAMAWVRASSASNFQLLGGQVASTSVDGIDAVRYTTDGLYATDNVVLVRDSRAYMFSVGWITRDDAIVSDFEQLLASVDIR